MFKKIITSIILACFIFVNVGSHFASVTHAQNWYFQNYNDWHQRVYDENNPDEIFGERYTAAQVEWVIYGIAAFIINHVVGDGSIIACVIRNALDEEALVAECIPIIGSVIGTITYNKSSNEAFAQSESPLKDLIFSERPISGVGYIRETASKFNIITEVSAQGFGFDAASSMRTLWVVVRDITYFFLILLIIGMSFLIMFRFKISPQTVITVQSALPKIFIALLLITFSYAIAGFMIDLLYVVIGIVAAVLSQSGLFAYLNGNNLTWADMYNRLTGANFGQGIFGVMFFYLIAFMVTCFYALSSNVLGFVGTLIGLTQLITLIIVVVVAIALIFILLKILWMLTKAYVSVLLLTAVGPIFIIVGGFQGWLKSLASNLAVFATIGPMLAISFLFLASGLPDFWFDTGFLPEPEDALASLMPFNPRANAFENSAWSPPFLPGGEDMDVIWLFASFVIMTLIPNVANIIKSMIDRRPFGYGTAIGAAIGAAAGTAWSPFGSVAGYTKEAYMKERGSAIATAITKSKYGQAMRRFLGG